MLVEERTTPNPITVSVDRQAFLDALVALGIEVADMREV